MNGRAYDYNLGRFLSVDPFIQAPGNSQSMNPYSYIMNNPLAGTDPSGYVAEDDKRRGRKKSEERDKRKADERGRRGFKTVYVRDNGHNNSNQSSRGTANKDADPSTIESQNKVGDSSKGTYSKKDYPETDREYGQRFRHLSESEQKEILKQLDSEIEMTDNLIKNIREGDPQTMRSVQQWTGYYGSDKKAIGKLVSHFKNISTQMKSWKSDPSLIRFAPMTAIGRAYPGGVSRPVYLGLSYKFQAGTFIHEASHYFGGKHYGNYLGLTGARRNAQDARDFEFYEFNVDPRPIAANNPYVIEHLAIGTSPF